ncbi:hypothetical protein CDIK_3472 [Cucumispora dikerogammari]|nr:hypothetical protein CDIK_3472 [Cucumispora dikerogammari]
MNNTFTSENQNNKNIVYEKKSSGTKRLKLNITNYDNINNTGNNTNNNNINDQHINSENASCGSKRVKLNITNMPNDNIMDRSQSGSTMHHNYPPTKPRYNINFNMEYIKDIDYRKDLNDICNNTIVQKE